MTGTLPWNCTAVQSELLNHCVYHRPEMKKAKENKNPFHYQHFVLIYFITYYILNLLKFKEVGSWVKYKSRLVFGRYKNLKKKTKKILKQTSETTCDNTHLKPVLGRQRQGAVCESQASLIWWIPSKLGLLSKTISKDKKPKQSQKSGIMYFTAHCEIFRMAKQC